MINTDNIQALILAAEGPSLSSERDVPSCLQPLLGGVSLLEQQVKTLRLAGLNLILFLLL